MPETSPERALVMIASVAYYNGELLAVMQITEARARELLRKASQFRAARRVNKDLHQMIEFGYDPTWIADIDGESDTFADDVPPEIVSAMFEWAEEEEDKLTSDRAFVVPPETLILPNLANCRTEGDKFIIEANDTLGRNESVDFRWEARLKHTDETFETPNIPEESIRRWLDSLATTAA